MKVTERYILMCKEAKEIQDMKPFAQKPCTSWDLGKWWVDWAGNYWTKISGRYIWLLTQGQTQGFLKVRNLRELYEAFNWTIINEVEGKKFIDFFETSEELWLAVLYFLEFNKVWSDKEKRWVSYDEKE